MKKNEKLPPKHPKVVERFVSEILKGRRFNRRPELLLQQIFASIAVQSSLDLGILHSSLDISGDGTCILSGASPRGVKVCSCTAKGIYDCKCPRKFSDPNASWGWDSSNERYFFGYSGYFISTYNGDLKVDLPLYLRLVDGPNAMIVFLPLLLWLKFVIFSLLFLLIPLCLILLLTIMPLIPYYTLGASNPIIALNKRCAGKCRYEEPIAVTELGAPICSAGHTMVNWGLCKDRNRIKYRCPLACGKINSCDHKQFCSPSAYGRTVYIKPEWDLRLFTPIPRHSPLWRNKMNQRTACERVNNRILNNYCVEKSKVRGKKRIFFLVTMAGINIHLDAQLKHFAQKDDFNFLTLLFGLLIC